MSLNSIFRTLVLLCCLLSNAHLAFAVEYTATGRIQYSGWSLDKEERRQAEIAAMINVIESYIAKEQPAHYRNYQKVKAQIDAEIDAYILDLIITDDNQNKDNKTYEVSIRASINEPKLMAILLDNDQRAASSDPAYLTFVFVAREVAGKQTRGDKSSTQTKTKGEEISQQSGENTAQRSKSQSKTIKMETEESIYSDVLLYRASTANEIDVAMGNVFSLADYLVIDAALLEEETDFLLNVKQFISDYENGNDLTPATKRNALKGLQQLEDPIDFLAIGTLDVDEQQLDPQTGKYRIAVSVTGQVLSIKRRGAAIAKVGPVQYSAEGSTITMAKNNALKLAAEEAAQELVAILSSKNI